MQNPLLKFFLELGIDGVLGLLTVKIWGASFVDMKKGWGKLLQDSCT